MKDLFYFQYMKEKLKLKNDDKDQKKNLNSKMMIKIRRILS